MTDLIQAALAVTGTFRRKAPTPTPITTRSLLLILKHEGELYVIVAKDPKDSDRFNFGKFESATDKAYSILSNQGKGPWPLFNQINMIRKGAKYRCGSFPCESIEYHALLIADCGMLGQAEGTSPLEALEAHSLSRVPLLEHPFFSSIKLVLQLK